MDSCTLSISELSMRTLEEYRERVTGFTRDVIATEAWVANVV